MLSTIGQWAITKRVAIYRAQINKTIIYVIVCVTYKRVRLPTVLADQMNPMISVAYAAYEIVIVIGPVLPFPRVAADLLFVLHGRVCAADCYQRRLVSKASLGSLRLYDLCTSYSPFSLLLRNGRYERLDMNVVFYERCGKFKTRTLTSVS